MADERQVIEKPAPKEIIAPGYTFGTVTDQIAAVVLTKKTPPLFWIGSFGAGFGLLLLFLLAVGILFTKGLGIWGWRAPPCGRGISRTSCGGSVSGTPVH